VLEDLRNALTESEEQMTVHPEHLAEFLELPSMYTGQPHTFHYWKRYVQGRNQENPRKVGKEELVRVLKDLDQEAEVTLQGRISETHIKFEIDSIEGYSYDGLRVSTPEDKPLPHPYRKSVRHLETNQL